MGTDADAGQPDLALHRHPDAEGVAEAVADLVADRLGRAIAQRGQGVVALSGGSTPLPMLRRLAVRELDWRRVHVLQVDERIAPDGHPDRNWTAVASLLVEPTGAHGHPMPVGGEPVGSAEAAAYAATVAELCDGRPDVVHLGLGADGHTASLVPGDPVLAVVDADVALTGPYQGRRRMTLTVPAIGRARTIVWQVVGDAKRAALRGVLLGDPTLPGSLIPRGGDVHVHADEAALPPDPPGR